MLNLFDANGHLINVFPPQVFYSEKDIFFSKILKNKHKKKKNFLKKQPMSGMSKFLIYIIKSSHTNFQNHVIFPHHV